MYAKFIGIAKDYLQVPEVDAVGNATPFKVTSAVRVYVLPLVTVLEEENSTYPLPESVQVARHELPFHNFTTSEIASLVELAETKTEQLAVVPSKLILGLIVSVRTERACALTGIVKISITAKQTQMIFFIILELPFC